MVALSDIPALALLLERSPVLAEHHCEVSLCDEKLLVHRDDHVFCAWVPVSQSLMLVRMGGSSDSVIESSVELAVTRTEQELIQFFGGVRTMLKATRDCG